MKEGFFSATEKSVASLIGEPFASIDSLTGSVSFYATRAVKDSIMAVEFIGGVALSSERERERRCHLRVVPQEPIPLAYSTGKYVFSGVVVDISTVGVAVDFSNPEISNAATFGREGLVSFELAGEAVEIKTWVYMFSEGRTVMLFINSDDGKAKDIVQSFVASFQNYSDKLFADVA